MTRITLLLLLLASTAHGACYTVTFEPSNVIPLRYAGNGLSAEFGNGWWVVGDADCPGCQLNDGVKGQFANEPSPSHVLYHDVCTPPPCDFYWFYIAFDPPVNQVSFQYTGRFLYEEFNDPSWNIYRGALPIEVHFYDGYGLPDHFDAVTATDDPVDGSGHAQSFYPHAGVGEGAPCNGDPGGEFCNWRTFSYTSVKPIAMIWIAQSTLPWWYDENGSWFGEWPGNPSGFWLDDMTICSAECPNPPCEFERASVSRDEGQIGYPRGERATDAKRTSWGKIKSIYR